MKNKNLIKFVFIILILCAILITLAFFAVTSSIGTSNNYLNTKIFIGIGCMLATIVGALFIYWRRYQNDKTIQLKIKELSNWIKAEYPNSEYIPNKFFLPKNYVGKKHIVNNTKIIDTVCFEPFCDFSGSDYFNYIDNDINFQCCNLTLQNLQMVGSRMSTFVKVFDGCLLLIDNILPKQISNNIVISTVGTLGYKRLTNKIPTENHEFNKTFNCYCESEKDLLYVLTPKVMNFLMELKMKHNDFAISFLTDGNVLLSLNSLTIFNGKETNEIKIAIKHDVSFLKEFSKSIKLTFKSN